MADNTYKDIYVSGNAVATPKEKRQRKSRKNQKGGNSERFTSLCTPPGLSDPNAHLFYRAVDPRVVGPYQAGGSSTGATTQLASTHVPTNGQPSNVLPVLSGQPVAVPAPVGGAIMLHPPKRRSHIALKAPKLKKNHNESRKAPRKIHIRARGVTARLAKAKKATKQAAAAPISQIKGRLESSGIIKKGSKAPDAMLRNMYADLLITKKGL